MRSSTRSARILLLAGLAAGSAAAPAMASDRDGPIAFGGYSFARLDDADRHGIHTGASFALAGRLSLFLDVSSHRGSREGASLSDLTAMLGPGMRLGRKPAFFVRALGGLVRSRASIEVLDVDISETDDRLGLLAGGGIDVPVGRRLMVRAQGDYLWSHVGEEGKAGGFRASLGLAYSFGSQP